MMARCDRLLWPCAMACAWLLCTAVALAQPDASPEELVPAPVASAEGAAGGQPLRLSCCRGACSSQVLAWMDHTLAALGYVRVRPGEWRRVASLREEERERLTSYLADMEFLSQPSWRAEGGAEVLTLCEQPILRDVYVCSGRVLEEEVRRRLVLRSGQFLDQDALCLDVEYFDGDIVRVVGSPQGCARFIRQAEAISRYLERQGFFGNRVRIRTLSQVEHAQRCSGERHCASRGYLGLRGALRRVSEQESCDPLAIRQGPPEAEVDLLVEVERGRPRVFGRLFLRVDGAEEQGREGEPTWVRLSADDERRVSSLLATRLAFVFRLTPQRLQAIAEAIRDLFRSQGYLQARYVLQETRPSVYAADTLDLYLWLQRGPRWRIEVTGQQRMTRRELLRALPFAETGIIDAEEVAGAVGEMQARYEQIGFANVQVQTERFWDDERGEQVLRFEIDEGERYVVRSVQISGVPEALQQGLLQRLGTKPYSAFGTSGYVQRSVLERDARTLEQALQEQGYLLARAVGVEVVQRAAGFDLDVHFRVRSGPQYRVADILLAPPSEQRRLAPALVLRVGGPFEPNGFEAQDQALRREVGLSAGQGVQSSAAATLHDSARCATYFRLRSDLGYRPERPAGACRRSLGALRIAAVSCPPDTLGEGCGEALWEEGPECAWWDTASSECDVDTVDVVLQHAVTEALDVARVGSLLTFGAFRTRARVLSRELDARPGEVLDERGLLVSQSNLRATRLFNSARVEILPSFSERGPGAEASGAEASGAEASGAEASGVEGGLVPLLVQVEETTMGLAEYRLGLETRFVSLQEPLVILSNEALLRHLSLGGSGVEGRLAGEFDFDIRDPGRLRDHELDAELRLVAIQPRTRWSRRGVPWETRGDLYYRVESLSLPPLPQQRTLAGELRFRRQILAGQGLFLEIGGQARRVAVRDRSSAALSDEGYVPTWIFSVVPRVLRDKRRGALDPTGGHFWEVSLEVADGLQSVLETASYVKLSGRGAAFWPLGWAPGQGPGSEEEPRRFVLGLGGRAGVALPGISDGFRPTGPYVLPLSERFLMGGVTSLRGFPVGAIRAPGREEVGGDWLAQGTLELRYPLLLERSLHAALFLDSGMLGRRAEDLRLSTLRTSVGLGVRWLIADLIPMVLDVGTLLDRRPGEGVARLHFNIGYTF